VNARDTHIVHLDWSNVETATLEIDHGSDGTIDETLELEDQVKQVYLPLILRSY